MTTVIDARFAGGPIVLDTIEANESRPALVEINLPGLTVALFNHEARALALALAAHLPLDDARRLFDDIALQNAGRATERTLKRRRDVIDELTHIDG